MYYHCRLVFSCYFLYFFDIIVKSLQIYGVLASESVPFACHFCAICDAERLGVPFVLHIFAILRTFASGNMKNVMQHEELCREVERQLRRKLKTRGDFDYLAEQIEKRTGEMLSSNTLMRLWGYRSSVTARQSTLDILSRFVGYEDYTHFMAANEIEEEEAGSDTNEDVPAQEEEQEAPTASTPHRFIFSPFYRRILFPIAVLALVIGAVFFLYEKTKTKPEPMLLTSVSELRNDRKYLIHTRNMERGSLGIESPELATTCPRAIFHSCDTASAFAILKFEDNFFLYSTVSNRFISINSFESNDPLYQNRCAIDIIMEQGYFVFNFWFDKSLGRVATLNVNWKDGVVITPWGTYNGIFDNGNLFTIEDAGHFDPTEALEKLRESADKHRYDVYHPDSLEWRQILFK